MSSEQTDPRHAEGEPKKMSEGELQTIRERDSLWTQDAIDGDAYDTLSDRRRLLAHVAALDAEIETSKKTIERWQQTASIIKNASGDHAKHYWCLIQRLKRRGKSAYDLANWIGEGSTVAHAIWAHYGDMTDAQIKAHGESEHAKVLAAVTEHRNQRLDDLCWEDDNRLYVACGLEPRDPVTCDKEKMLANCARYIERRCKPGTEWKSYQELDAENATLQQRLAALAEPKDGELAICLHVSLMQEGIFTKGIRWVDLPEARRVAYEKVIQSILVAAHVRAQCEAQHFADLAAANERIAGLEAELADVISMRTVANEQSNFHFFRRKETEVDKSRLAAELSALRQRYGRLVEACERIKGEHPFKTEIWELRQIAAEALYQASLSQPAPAGGEPEPREAKLSTMRGCAPTITGDKTVNEFVADLRGSGGQEQPPCKTPELLFTDGPLRNAAQAGWHAARGEQAAMEACREAAIADSQEPSDRRGFVDRGNAGYREAIAKAREPIIRLSCEVCDEQHDGITPKQLAALVQAGWRNVEEAAPSEDPLDWETHTGICPECAAEQEEPVAVEPGVYRHYKGALYDVLGIAGSHDGSLPPVVVYRQQSSGRLFIRPVEEFLEMADGGAVKRFEMVEQTGQEVGAEDLAEPSGDDPVIEVAAILKSALDTLRARLEAAEAQSAEAATGGERL